MRQKTLTISDDVRDVLIRSSVQTDRVVLPPEQLERKHYEAVAKVLDAAGGKWNKKACAFLFPKGVDPIVIFASAIHSGQIVRDKQTAQAFYTPESIVRMLIRHADLRPGVMVLEPSAGEGAIVQGLIEADLDTIVTAVEQNPRASAILTERFGRTQRVHLRPETDFLTCTPRVGFEATKRKTDVLLHDRVIMNPPFNDGQEIEHVLHAIRFLKPGGRLVSVMSNGVMCRNDTRYEAFRKKLDRSTREWAFDKLPSKSFHESGTDVETVVLVLIAEDGLP